jgi:outer membrane lipoprotein-sorting protein
LSALISAVVFGMALKTNAESAEDILKKVDNAQLTKSSKMTLSQKLITPSGDERTFKMEVYSQNGDEKGLTKYVWPKQVAGMKILTLNDGDDIWTYFPSTNRTRKIASSARNRKVQGSDFTYDDMATGKMSKRWQGTLQGTEKVAGTECYKLALKPTSKGPKSYSKISLWVDKARYTPIRIEYYDLDGERIKRLDIGDYRKKGQVLIPFAYKMTNLTDGGKTLMKVSEAEVDVPLDNTLFTEAGLSR